MQHAHASLRGPSHPGAMVLLPLVPQVLSRLIKGYNFRFQPRSHAVDLIGTLHVVLGMLDRLSLSLIHI